MNFTTALTSQYECDCVCDTIEYKAVECGSLRKQRMFIFQDRCVSHRGSGPATRRILITFCSHVLGRKILIEFVNGQID